MTVFIACDRCQRVEPIAVNERPAGWLSWPYGWPDVLGGREQDVCPRCVTLIEQQALAEWLEVER